MALLTATHLSTGRNGPAIGEAVLSHLIDSDAPHLASTSLGVTNSRQVSASVIWVAMLCVFRVSILADLNKPAFFVT